MRARNDVRSCGTNTPYSPGSFLQRNSPLSLPQLVFRYRQASTSRWTKKLLSRIADVLGIRNGCSAGLEDAAVVIFSSRNSLLGVTSREPLLSLHSYFTNSAEPVICNSELWTAESEAPVPFSRDFTVLMPFSCCTLKVSVRTRWPLTKTPNEPESTICPPGFGLSFLSPAYNMAAPATNTTAPHRIRAITVTVFLFASRRVYPAVKLELSVLRSPRPFFR